MAFNYPNFLLVVEHIIDDISEHSFDESSEWKMKNSEK